MIDPYVELAEEDFSRARTREFLSRVQGFLDPSRTRLLSLDEVREILKPEGETYLGMQAVPVERIVGSEGRYKDFNSHFLPRFDHLRPRWVRVNLAHYNDINLPPIQLYEAGGVYFVRDGNHRVSVARTQGVQAIDAEVVSLNTRVALEPGMGLEDLRKAVIAYEKEKFYRNTDFLEVTGDGGLDFTSTGQYDVALNHVLVHKYYINQDKTGEIPFRDALLSWYRSVYRPIVDIIREDRIPCRFPGRTASDLYVYIVKHWDHLKRKYGLAVSPKEAVADFSTQYGRSYRQRLKTLLGSILRK
jgi:hypothetical protein